ncbi:MAG: hypothetical protein ACKVPX_13600 [Myxococcaceae bacterium]
MMRSRAVLAAVVFTVLCAGAAVFSYVRAASLRHDAQWLLARANAHAAEYATSFNPTLADQQFATFEARASLLRDVANWERLQMLGVLGAVVGLFGSYVLYLMRRLQQQIIEGAPELAELPHR